MTLSWLLSILVMLVGFGFVIFWHELGHFLGARRAGVRVEQFAVGMGPAVFSFRKGIGLRLGSSQNEFETRVQAEFHAREIREKERRDAEGRNYEIHVGELSVREKYDIAKDLGMGETEYRLSLLPIGGYVKPTGQDDLRPSHVAAGDDPHSYAAAPVGKRMVLISAGVIMNVILAGILFFVLFRFVGFDVTRSMVGQVESDSPAAQAGLVSGDELLELDGTTLHDFTKILMNVALLPDDRSVDLKIRRDGVEKTLTIRARTAAENNDMLALGIGAPTTLVGRPASDFEKDGIDKLSPEEKLVLPGEQIVAINGQPVDPKDPAAGFTAFQRAIQESFGQPVKLTIADTTGATHEGSFVPRFAGVFNRDALQLLSMSPRTRIASLQDNSSAAGKLMAGDVVLSMTTAGKTTIELPSMEDFRTTSRAAGASGDTLSFVVERDGKRVDVADVKASTKLTGDTKKAVGLGAAIEPDLDHAVVGEIEKGSPLAADGAVTGSTLTAVGGKPVASWYDLHRALVERGKAATPLNLTFRAEGGAERTITITPSDAEVAAALQLRYANPIATLDDLKRVRQTDSTLTALGWGVTETRDLILQGYLMLKRVTYNHTVPASNLSGPLGIFRAGTNFAQRGAGWFIWFLAVISANLAVVNFLPVPILDGWHFLGLVKEKVTGKPVSERVQEVAQYIGLLLILSLIVFVTYNDIMRL